MLFKKVVLAGVAVCLSAAGEQGSSETAVTQPAGTQAAAAQPERAFPPLETHPYKHKPLGWQQILALPAAHARVEMMTALAWGGQSFVERHLPQLVTTYPQDQPLLFFQAVLIRSRFEVKAAEPFFEAVVSLDANTPEGKCAALMLKIDHEQETLDSIRALCKIADNAPEDILIQWIAAIGCRTVRANVAGCQIYDFIFRVFYPGAGPVLMHQTYANLLDETGQHEKALKHRQMAVKMEPAAWSYEGLANTLTDLKRYPEAEEAYAKSVELNPKEEMYWRMWGHCELKAGKYRDAEGKFQKAVGLDANNPGAYEGWGEALEAEKKFDQALTMYRRAIATGDRTSYLNAARVLRVLNRVDEAQEMEDQANRTGM